MKAPSIPHLLPPGGERRSGENDRTTPPIVAIGGVLTIKQLLPLYQSILNLDKSSRVSAGGRFVPPHGRGTGPVDATLGKTRERLLRIHESLGERRMLLVGHSLGTLLATIFAYENPEAVAGVVCLAGVQEGVKHDTLAMRGLIAAINNPSATALVRHDSGFMQEHRERVRTEWPAEVPLHVVSTAHDVLLPPPHGFGLEPNGQPSTNTLLVTKGHSFRPHVRQIVQQSPEDTSIVTTAYHTGHLTFPLNPTVVGYVGTVRDELASPVEMAPALLEPAV